MALTKRKAKKAKSQSSLVQLIRRLADLMIASVRQRRSTPELRRTIYALKADVERWNKITGRRDLRASARVLTPGDPDPFTCRKCEWMFISPGRICFFVECDPVWSMCGYICFDIYIPPSPP